MFHLKTDEVVKDSICQSYQDPNGNIRVILCSTSFSMGLDVKGVDTVIHYGPANDIDDYVQESGRAGRNPLDECHGILLTYKRCLGSQNISKEMKEYVKLSSCRRKYILRSFNTSTESKYPIHLCCDNCRKNCTCSCKCQNESSCVTKACAADIPGILSAILSTKPTSDNDDSDSTNSSFDSDDFDFHIARKPNVISSSDDDN